MDAIRTQAELLEELRATRMPLVGIRAGGGRYSWWLDDRTVHSRPVDRLLERDQLDILHREHPGLGGLVVGLRGSTCPRELVPGHLDTSWCWWDKHTSTFSEHRAGDL